MNAVKKTVQFSFTKIQESKAYRIQESRNPSKKESVIFFPTQNPRIQESSQKDSSIFFDSESKNPGKKDSEIFLHSDSENPRIMGSKNTGIQPKKKMFLLKIQESRHPAKKDSAISLYSESKNPRLVGIQESRNQAT